jgi:hypothetical protein
MNKPTLPRLMFYTVAVLAGVVAMLTDRFSGLGIVLIGFSHIILMRRRDQKHHWSAPLTRWQIVRGFIPLMLMIAIIAFYVIARERGSEPSETTMNSISSLSKLLFLIALVFLLGQPWLTWYRSRNIVDAPNESG